MKKERTIEVKKCDFCPYIEGDSKDHERNAFYKCDHCGKDICWVCQDGKYWYQSHFGKFMSLNICPECKKKFTRSGISKKHEEITRIYNDEIEILLNQFKETCETEGS